MRTIALRFGETFAPSEGTIAAHQKTIEKYGFVWYGKFGIPISAKVASYVLENDKPRILLIQSGKNKRYWAYVANIQWEKPSDRLYPSYYEQVIERFKTWFKVIKIEEAPSDIMSKCHVASSGSLLAHASRSSMSPYFIINIE